MQACFESDEIAKDSKKTISIAPVSTKKQKILDVAKFPYVFKMLFDTVLKSKAMLLNHQFITMQHPTNLANKHARLGHAKKNTNITCIKEMPKRKVSKTHFTEVCGN